MKEYLEQQYQNKRICGIDEVARGNWGGNVIVAGAILKDYHLIPNEVINLINDSKTTKSFSQRMHILSKIKPYLLAYDVEFIDVNYIENYNIKQSAIYGMEQVINALSNQTDIFFVDAEKPKSIKPLQSFIKGDAKSLNIATASLIAKTCLDLYFQELLMIYPNLDEIYGFSSNSGYGTKKHQDGLNNYGKIIGFHRNTYAPIQKIKAIYLTIPNEINQAIILKIKLALQKILL